MPSQYLHLVDLNELLSGTTATITAKPLADSDTPSSYTITVPCALVCGLLEHFETALNSGFAERQVSTVTLTDVEPWLLRLFGSWLYSTNLSYDDQTVLSFPAHLKDIIKRDKDAHENLPRAPVSWSCEVLFQVYQFADQYSTRLLRQAVFTEVQYKLLRLRPSIYQVPDMEAIAFVANSLPATSPLWQLLTYVVAYDYVSGFADDISSLPSDFLAECLRLCQSGEGRELREKPWCWLHEHEGEHERVECFATEHEVSWQVRAEEDMTDADHDKVARTQVILDQL